MVNEPEIFNHLMVKHRLDTHLDTLGLCLTSALKILWSKLYNTTQ